MRKILWTAVLLLAQCGQSIILLSRYDTIWTTQSENSADSVPLGGGSVGLNVWAEDATILYSSIQRAFTNNWPGEILLYIAHSGAFDENNFLLEFGRRLHLNAGYMTLRGDDNTNLKSWVDMETSGAHVDVTSNVLLNLTASFESRRTRGRQIQENEQRQTSWATIYYHHNWDTPLYDFQIAGQNLSDADRELFFNPMSNNTFGIFVDSPQLRQGATTDSKIPASDQQQMADVDGWVSDLVDSAKALSDTDQSDTVSWWRSFWDWPHIVINPNASSTDAGFQVGKNYQYFRYIRSCNAKGKYPTKFNGGLFTFDPVLTPSGDAWIPDYRKCGDWGILRQRLDFYKDITPTSRKLGQVYLGLGIGLTSEQIDNTGLPNVYEYDTKHFNGEGPRTALFPPGICFGEYLDCNMDIDEYIPFVEYQVGFFDEYYQKRNGLDANGSLILHPGTITDLLLTDAELYLSRLPETPLRPCPGATTLQVNSEPTALYAAFPWASPSPPKTSTPTDSPTAPATASPRSKGPKYDWSPDINHYGSAAIGLQEMLIQTFARNHSQIRLLPAWPRQWTGSF
ncbi:uncharacterized protein BDV17DRAFT_284890 [Aspergillus undulatus]|uniref:uncharacterized protein n=1 Tax=Aspergillus undulatus TaxID=1810928 RepID=UPI003CCCC465